MKMTNNFLYRFLLLPLVMLFMPLISPKSVYAVSESLFTEKTPNTILYAIDKDKTKIQFQIGRHAASDLSGFFADYQIMLAFFDCDLNKGNIDVAIYADSADMGNVFFESVLKSRRWFNTEVFPLIYFNSDSIKLSEQSSVTGELKLRGISQPLNVNMDIEYQQSLKKKQQAPKMFTFTGKTAFNRIDFGMDAFQQVIENQAQIEISGQFNLLKNNCRTLD